MRVFTSLLVASAIAFAAEVRIDGKWATEMHMSSPDGRSYTNKSTFVLKNSGGVLTGKMESNGASVEIRDGKLEGDKFTFRVQFEGNKGTKTITYEGTVHGDRLQGNLKVRGIGQTWPFEATRSR